LTIFESSPACPPRSSLIGENTQRDRSTVRSFESGRRERKILPSSDSSTEHGEILEHTGLLDETAATSCRKRWPLVASSLSELTAPIACGRNSYSDLTFPSRLPPIISHRHMTSAMAVEGSIVSCSLTLGLASCS